jgi:GntR family transcriptional regulator, transcriptional repressor for pyruvate dehydrogenase complex
VSALLTPLNREKLNEKIVSQVKAVIFSSGIEIGQRLPSERELAGKFRVSRVVVREALKSLEQSGLIEVRTGAAGGAFVADNLHIPLFNSAHDLWKSNKLTLQHFAEVRNAVERASARLAAQYATPEDIARLREINQRLLDDLETREKLRGHNAAFHVAVAEISGNPLIKLIVQSLLVLLHTLVPSGIPTQYRTFIKEMHKRHEAIIQALEARDAALSEQVMARETEFTKMLRQADKRVGKRRDNP